MSNDAEATYFEFRATLRITGNNLDLDEVTRSLGLAPTHVHKKGDRRSRHPDSVPYEHDMWAFTAPVDKARPLEEHIRALWEALRPHAALRSESKNQLRSGRVLRISQQL
jgi:hypothetical protein